jgi:hypothetical protein
MGDKYLCTGVQCSVYVFGESSGGHCPECGNEGQALDFEQLNAFQKWYERVQEWRRD